MAGVCVTVAIMSPISPATGGVQSAIVMINDDYIGSVSCEYAPGTTVQGCLVSFTRVTTTEFNLL